VIIFVEWGGKGRERQDRTGQDRVGNGMGREEGWLMLSTRVPGVWRLN